MCTLTVVPHPGGRVRLAFNRDEQRSRPAARPPEVRSIGRRRAVLPIDPVSGGTWLAVNDAGLVFALLNANPQDPGISTRPSRSRGDVIRAMLDQNSPAAALVEIERTLRFDDFQPFRLVLIGHGLTADVYWDGHRPMVLNRLIGGAPLLFTSSGLGDALVEGVRRDLFNSVFAGPTDRWDAAQDKFHSHSWADRKHLSVNMDRADARTVSYAVIDLGPSSATFVYHPDAPDRPAERSVVHIPVAASVT